MIGTGGGRIAAGRKNIKWRISRRCGRSWRGEIVDSRVDIEVSVQVRGAVRCCDCNLCGPSGVDGGKV